MHVVSEPWGCLQLEPLVRQRLPAPGTTVMYRCRHAPGMQAADSIKLMHLLEHAGLQPSATCMHEQLPLTLQCLQLQCLHVMHQVYLDICGNY